MDKETKETIKKIIDDAADEILEKEAPKYGLTVEEVKLCAEQMKDPDYRAKIHEFAKEEIHKRKKSEKEVRK